VLNITSSGVPSLLWTNLKQSLQKVFNQEINYKVDTDTATDVHIQYDFYSQNQLIPGKFKVLILGEPKSVIPWQYKKKNLNRFDLIIAVGEKRAQNLKIKTWINASYDFEKFLSNESLRNRSAVMINSAKFSSNKSSLYGFRRSLSMAMHRSDLDYDLIGDNWHMPKTKELRERIWALRKDLLAGYFPSLSEAFSHFFYKYPEYIGRVDDKFNAFSKYKYALIIENEADYVSEKLFDAIAAGCVPIYVGPNLSRYKNLAKCVMAFEPSVNLILDYFKSGDKTLFLEKKQFIDNQENYLGDIQYFSSEFNSMKVARLIFENIKI